MDLKAMKARRAELIKSASDLRSASGDEISSEDASKIKAMLDEVDTLSAQIEQMENSAAELDRRLKATETVMSQSRGRQTAPGMTTAISTTELIAKDPKKGFQNPRQFMMAVMNAEKSKGKNIPDNLKYMKVDNWMKRSGMVEEEMDATAGSDEQGAFSDPYGGYFVPIGFSPSFLKLDPEEDPMAGRTTMIPMATPKVSFNARVDKNHATSVSGGLVVSRSAETIAKTTSRMKFEQVVLSAYSLFGAAFATEEILFDSPISFAALIASGFQDEFTNRLIDERLNGSGVGEFLGVMNSPALVTVNKESAQAADTITLPNLYKMRARCWKYANAIWMFNHDCLPQLATLNQSLGTAGGQVMWQPSAREDHPDLLLGRPVIFTEYTKTLGDLGDVVLGNWSQYLEGIYQPMQSAESIHVRFLNHERCYKFWMRNAGEPWWKSAMTPKNSTATMSPFVTLEAR